MKIDEKKRVLHLGFLTVLGSSRHGVIGGFLVLNRAGRPAEFHCTAPVRPNRAQEILYGATLESFVCGEQIAPALVGRTKLELVAILTNNPNMLVAQPLLNVPVGLVFRHASCREAPPREAERFAEWDHQRDGVKKEVSNSGTDVVDAVADSREVDASREEGSFFYESLETLPNVPGVDYSFWREIIRGPNRMALPAEFYSETYGRVTIDECALRIDPFLKSIDSVEPFERIRLAIEEAQKSC